MPGFRVTPRARDDLKNIGRYTERQWGKRQGNACLKTLEKRFGWLDGALKTPQGIQQPALGNMLLLQPEAR